MMRHAIAVLVLVGCGDPASTSTVEIYPGPVATVTQGGLLQLAARVDAAPANSITFDLVIDDPIAGLFDVHDITPTEAGAIVSLVPNCTALPNGATSGVVSMSVAAHGVDAPPATLTIDIVADTNGVCDGAPEHVVTFANLQVANVPDSAGVLCTSATVGETSAHDIEREVVRVYGPNNAMARNGHLLCGTADVRLELWPPIDAPAVETIKVDTFVCATDGCATPASTCCDLNRELATPLTSSKITVPTRSVAELDDVEGNTLACADLDGSAAPVFVLAQNNKTTALVGTAGRFASQAGPHITNLLGFVWQSGPLPGDIESTILGGSATGIVRAQRGGDGMVSWIADSRLTFATGSVPPSPDAVLPIPTVPGGGARYVARIVGGNLDVSCISASCSADFSIVIDIGGPIPLGFGIADYDGDGDEDIIVAYRDATGTIGASKPVYLYAFNMDWSPPTPIATLQPAPLATLEEPGYDVHLAAIPAQAGAAPCERIYLLSRGAFSTIEELTPSTCGASPTTLDATPVPVVNDVRSIATIDRRLVAATALGVFELTNGDNSAWRLQDPLLDEHIIATHETLIDSTSRYGEQFVPCYVASTPATPTVKPSIAFRIARGGFEWTELDTPVDTFSVGSSP